MGRELGNGDSQLLGKVGNWEFPTWEFPTMFLEILGIFGQSRECLESLGNFGNFQTISGKVSGKFRDQIGKSAVHSQLGIQFPTKRVGSWDWEFQLKKVGNWE